MYLYNSMDRTFVASRVSEFRAQVERRLAGELAEEEFLPLRLQNGLYRQRHAYMLRVGVPYGLLNSEQIRTFATIADTYDRGFGHFTTRQNIQFNWLELENVPDILDLLAQVDMHAMQTSGNCVRNITSDPLAGVSKDEIIDPRPMAEMLRQYKEIHPEFLFLPRKFKYAITGAETDRAATAFHDIGIQAVQRGDEIAWKVLVGGGIGRTPRVGQVLYPWVETERVVGVVEAILRVYNLAGRRDKKYKARIKILVGEMGIDAFREAVDQELPHVDMPIMDMEKYKAICAMFERNYPESPTDVWGQVQQSMAQSPEFARWIRNNVKQHKVDGYHAVYVSLKAKGQPPGDATSDQLRTIADLMDRYNESRCVATYNQNLLFQNVRTEDLVALYSELEKAELATPNIDGITDQICCPGLDFCNLASASSIPIAKQITERFQDPAEVEDIGQLHLNMSGCVNACGHHHTGHIGILGVDRRGTECYQVKIGGHPGSNDELPAAIGEIVGPSVTADELIPLLDRILNVYKTLRNPGETFLAAVQRLGMDPFKEVARND